MSVLSPLITSLMLLAVLAAGGCSRSYYREQADDEVYQLVDHVATDPRWPLDRYTIEVDPRSRMYDPSTPDRPPMPTDDPTAHRLMHRVDTKAGYPFWHINGETTSVENPEWALYLDYDDNGVVVLSLDDAVETALVQSTNFQRQLENLYLSALDVTFERFRFDAQFFGGNSTFYTADGRLRSGSSSSLLDTTTDAQLRRMSTSGGQLVVGLANSFIWQFAGANSNATTTLLDFSLLQPLLRAGGRARVMERLTLSERSLLNNVRQMERFRRGFYAKLATGRDTGSGPSRRGGFFGGSGLEGFAGVGGGGFGRVGGGTGGGGGGAGTTGGAGAVRAGGYLGLLQTKQEIRNQQGNVSALEEGLAQLAASFLAGRIDRFQVDQARQALYNSQSRLLSSQVGYETSLDGYKTRLGLPPDLKVRIEDSVLDRFDLIAPELRGVQQSLSAVQVAAGQQIVALRRNISGPQFTADMKLDTQLARLGRLLFGARTDHDGVIEYLPQVQADVDRLARNVEPRITSLKALKQRVRAKRHKPHDSIFDLGYVRALPKKLTVELQKLDKKVRATPDELIASEKEISNLRRQAATLEGEALKARVTDLANHIPDLLADVSTTVLEVSLIQARARTETFDLVSVDLTSEQALRIARDNRRDWMNARSLLVDSWRLIEFNANDLESDLNLVFSGDISNTGNNPVNLQSATGRLRVGLEFDAPLTRLSERNVYRQALIEYQQARRSYYQFVDGVNGGLRNTMRTIELNKLNFEIRRAATRIAIDQVELIRLRLGQPPKPGQDGGLGATTARDLIGALTDLLNVQNDFLSVWVNYEVQRLSLDFDLGTMRLDQRGIWIDPGEITADQFSESLQNEADGETVEVAELRLLDFDLDPAPIPAAPSIP